MSLLPASILHSFRIDKLPHTGRPWGRPSGELCLTGVQSSGIITTAFSGHGVQEQVVPLHGWAQQCVRLESVAEPKANLCFAASLLHGDPAAEGILFDAVSGRVTSVLNWST